VRDSSIVVVPSFDERFHVKRVDDPPFTTWNIMVDWGGVRDYTHGLLYTYDYLRNKIVFKEEFLFYENTPTSNIWPKVMEWRSARRIPIDNVRADAPGQTIVDIAGVYKETIALPNKEDWQASINFMNVSFGQGLIEIDPDCKFLIESLRSGTFNKQRNDFARSKTLGHCDAIACIMYALRHYDKNNPYPQATPPADAYFYRPKDDGDEMLTGMVGKAFGNFK
jgi:hypothetical protein